MFDSFLDFTNNCKKPAVFSDNGDEASRKAVAIIYLFNGQTYAALRLCCACLGKALTYYVCCGFYVATADLLRFISTTQHAGRRVQSRGVFDRKYSVRQRRRAAPLNDLLGDYHARTPF